MGRGLLIASFDFSGVPEDEFNDWYDLEHIPERQNVTGFDLCERSTRTFCHRQCRVTAAPGFEVNQRLTGQN